MTNAEIYLALDAIFRDLFLDDDIELKPETSARDIKGWDSFNHINIIIAAEARFAIKLKTAEIAGLNNVGDFVRVIKSHTH
jgi:acyl carrier protein